MVIFKITMTDFTQRILKLLYKHKPGFGSFKRIRKLLRHIIFQGFSEAKNASRYILQFTLTQTHGVGFFIKNFK
jgi:hypothetical protein